MQRWRIWSLGLGAAVLAAGLGAHVYRAQTADAVRFERSRAQYEAQIARTPPLDGQPRLIAWPWRETGAAIGAQVLQTLVYDGSDELARKPGRLTESWRGRASGRLQSIADAIAAARADDLVKVKSMGGHFYLVTETLQ